MSNYCQPECAEWSEVVWRSPEFNGDTYMATRYCVAECGRATNWAVMPTNSAYGNTGHSKEELSKASLYGSFQEALAAKKGYDRRRATEDEIFGYLDHGLRVQVIVPGGARGEVVAGFRYDNPAVPANFRTYYSEGLGAELSNDFLASALTVVEPIAPQEDAELFDAVRQFAHRLGRLNAADIVREFRRNGLDIVQRKS